MVDIHSHLIPAVDNGSQSIEGSLQRFQIMAGEGVTDVILTSHYTRGRQALSFQMRQEQVDLLQRSVDEAGISIRLHNGAEVHYQPGIQDDIVKEKLTLADSKYILIECDSDRLSPDFETSLYMMIKLGYKPILSHVERYSSVMNHVHKAESLIAHGIYLQVNASSLLGDYGTKVKKTAWRLLQHGWAHFVASDDHGRNHAYKLSLAHEKICTHIDKRTADLLTEHFPRLLLQNAIVPYKYVSVTKSARGTSKSRKQKHSVPLLRFVKKIVGRF